MREQRGRCHSNELCLSKIRQSCLPIFWIWIAPFMNIMWFLIFALWIHAEANASNRIYPELYLFSIKVQICCYAFDFALHIRSTPIFRENWKLPMSLVHAARYWFKDLDLKWLIIHMHPFLLSAIINNQCSLSQFAIDSAELSAYLHHLENFETYPFHSAKNFPWLQYFYCCYDENINLLELKIKMCHCSLLYKWLGAPHMS